MRTVVGDEGDRLLSPEVVAQRTSTGPTATCGVSVSSSSCATFLLTSCQVQEGTLVRGKGDFPSGLVYDEEGETDYYDPKSQLNKQCERDRVQAAAGLSTFC
jgi:hypothetical protein